MLKVPPMEDRKFELGQMLTAPDGWSIYIPGYAQVYGEPPPGWRVFPLDGNMENLQIDNFVALPPKFCQEMCDLQKSTGCIFLREELESKVRACRSESEIELEKFRAFMWAKGATKQQIELFQRRYNNIRSKGVEATRRLIRNHTAVIELDARRKKFAEERRLKIPGAMARYKTQKRAIQRAASLQSKPAPATPIACPDLTRVSPTVVRRSK